MIRLYLANYNFITVKRKRDTVKRESRIGQNTISEDAKRANKTKGPRIIAHSKWRHINTMLKLMQTADSHFFNRDHKKKTRKTRKRAYERKKGRKKKKKNNKQLTVVATETAAAASAAAPPTAAQNNRNRKSNGNILSRI